MSLNGFGQLCTPPKDLDKARDEQQDQHLEHSMRSSFSLATVQLLNTDSWGAHVAGVHHICIIRYRRAGNHPDLCPSASKQNRRHYTTTALQVACKQVPPAPPAPGLPTICLCNHPSPSLQSPTVYLCDNMRRHAAHTTQRRCGFQGLAEHRP